MVYRDSRLRASGCSFVAIHSGKPGLASGSRIVIKAPIANKAGAPGNNYGFPADRQMRVSESCSPEVSE
jgi:hypothetical protein